MCFECKISDLPSNLTPQVAYLEILTCFERKFSNLPSNLIHQVSYPQNPYSHIYNPQTHTQISGTLRSSPFRSHSSDFIESLLSDLLPSDLIRFGRRVPMTHFLGGPRVPPAVRLT